MDALMECLGISWWQWWILVAVTVNTTINAIVFTRGRKIKKDERSNTNK